MLLSCTLHCLQSKWFSIHVSADSPFSHSLSPFVWIVEKCRVSRGQLPGLCTTLCQVKRLVYVMFLLLQDSVSNSNSADEREAASRMCIMIVTDNVHICAGEFVPIFPRKHVQGFRDYFVGHLNITRFDFLSKIQLIKSVLSPFQTCMSLHKCSVSISPNKMIFCILSKAL